LTELTELTEFFRQEEFVVFLTGGQDFQEITGWAEGVWTEFTELIELERSRFIICLSAGISGSSFFE
jgi:hypothetical protein